jgi:hypothetical protein
MPTTMAIDGDAIRILGHSIIFVLHLQQEYTGEYTINREQKQLLRILFNELCAQQRSFQFNESPTIVKIASSYYCEDGFMELPTDHLELMTNSVARLFECVRSAKPGLARVVAWPPDRR